MATFCIRPRENGDFDLKLTTARDIQPDPEPTARIAQMLGYGITQPAAYLSDGQTPFDRRMTEAVFMQRMRATLQRRFRERAQPLAEQQWRLFQQDVFSRQEDHLRDDYVLATYDHLARRLGGRLRLARDTPALDGLRRGGAVRPPQPPLGGSRRRKSPRCWSACAGIRDVA